ARAVHHQAEHVEAAVVQPEPVGGRGWRERFAYALVLAVRCDPGSEEGDQDDDDQHAAPDERLRRGAQRLRDGVFPQASALGDDEPLGLGAHSATRGSRRTYSRSAIRLAITIDVVMIRKAPCSIG